METPTQSELFETPDDPHEALRVLVMRLGGVKRVAHRLWPEKPMEQAAILLNNCLNHDRPEKLDLHQLDWLIGQGRAAGCHIVMQCFGLRHGYHIDPIEPEEEMRRLELEFIDSAQHLEKMLARIQSLKTNGLKAVK
jgi:hypothetical protein